MATGTSGGLLDSSDEHAQSVFKHEILRQYVRPFAAMTGSRSPGHRVVVLDGFAGRGRASSGQPASAELLLQTAESLHDRSVEAFFVERNPSDYRNLQAVVAEYLARGVVATAWHGDVAAHLDQVVHAAIGVPLFLFLDPCGANLPVAALAQVLAGARRAERPPTEVLLNFSADLTRRTAGAVAKGRLGDPGVARMDTTCGGEWWRETALHARASSPTGSFEQSAEAVAVEYAQRLGQTTAMRAVTLPVRRRLHHQPIYHLVFLTRAPHGLWVFAAAAAIARQKWLRHLGPSDPDDDGALFTLGDTMEAIITGEQEKAATRVRTNLRAMVEVHSALTLVDHTLAVFGDAYGIATERTVRTVVRAMERAGEISVLTQAKQLRDYVIAGRRR